MVGDSYEDDIEGARALGMRAFLLDREAATPRSRIGSHAARAAGGARADPSCAERMSMEYVNLGNTGLRVSRVCLGMMSYGKHESREWALDEAAAEPIVRRAVEAGITFFDTADVYNGGQSEVVTGRLLRALLRHARGVRRRDEGARQDDARRERPRRSRGSTSWRRSTRRSRASSSTTSTSTRSTAGTSSRRSRRRWTRSTTSCRPARRATSARAACTPGSSRRPSTWRTTPLRVDAEPLQPHLPRGGAGDDPAVPRPGRRRAAVEPARARAPRRQPSRAAGERLHDAREHRPVPGLRSTGPSSTSPVIDRAAEVAAARGVPPAQVALAWLLHKPRRDGADRRGDEGRARRRRARRCGARAERRRAGASRGAVRAPPGLRHRALAAVARRAACGASRRRGVPPRQLSLIRIEAALFE